MMKTFSVDLIPQEWNLRFLDAVGQLEIPLTTPFLADIIIKQADYITPEDLSSGKKFIVLERTDGANISHRKLLQHPAVIKYVKRYNLSHFELHNAPCVDGRYFTSYLMEAELRSEPAPPITFKDYSKIQVGFNFLHTAGMNALVSDQLDILEEDLRPTDVFFAGTIEYEPGGRRKSGDLITQHRMRCLHQINTLAGTVNETYPGKVLKRKDYLEKLRKTKIAVSPWGWGEACYRDYEAILSGCILIKPLTHYVSSSCNLFDDKFCVWVRPDFNDLQEKVNQVLAGWTISANDRTENRNKLINSFNEFNSIVQKILSE